MRRPALLLLAVLIAMPAAAQNTDIEALAGLQFNFSNPGARALGMGGAFLGLADDASAAEANPAGLTILRKPEISIEARNYLEHQVFTTSGTFPNVGRTAFPNHSDRAVVSFASVVVPWRRMTIGAYFHEPLRNEGGGLIFPTRDPITQAVTPLPNFYLPADGPEPVTRDRCREIVQEENDPLACLEYRIDPFVSALEVRQQTYGLAAGFQVHPRFSVGLTARYQKLDERAATFRYKEVLVRGVPTYQLTTISYQATARVTEAGGIESQAQTDVTFGAGFKWAPSDMISIGGVYKQGPSFAAPLFFAGPQTSNLVVQVAEPQFHMPDVAGLGVSVRPIPALTLNLDAVHVTYSNLVDDFISLAQDVQDLDQPYHANDVTELRFGAEYFFATRVPFALRAGYWRDPAHSVEYRGPLNSAQFVAEALLYPKGETRNHITVGAGVAWPRFQIDAAYDHSEGYKVGSISMVTRF